MSKPLTISIITPSYNHGQFLEQTMLSVLDQDYPNIEYIIMDGRSTDNSVDIIRKHELRLNYWISEKDRGHLYALQKGFARATGDVVAWQNADDFYEPNVFGAVMEVFKRDPDVDLVYGNVRLVDEGCQPAGELRFVPTNHWSMLFEGLTMHNQAAFFRKRLWDSMGGITFEDSIAFDYDLFIRATKYAKKVHYIHKMLGNYRWHAGSITFGGGFERIRIDPWVTRRRYMSRPWASIPSWMLKPVMLASLARRTYWHMRLGDWDYLGRGVNRRILRRLALD